VLRPDALTQIACVGTVDEVENEYHETSGLYIT